MIPNRIPADTILEIIASVEQLEKEKDAIIDDIKDIYSAAREDGFDPIAIKAIVSERKKAAKDDAKRRARIASIKEYAEAIGQGELFP